MPRETPIQPVQQSIQYRIDTAIIARGLPTIIDTLLKDDQLEEIVYNGPTQPLQVYHKRDGFIQTNARADEGSARAWIDSVVRANGKTVNEDNPLFDGTLQDGSRVNITIPPASPQNSTITIRKFARTLITVLDFIRQGALDARNAAFLWTAIEGLGARAANILVVGGTGTGKTTALNAFAMFIPAQQRIVTIEDTAELQIPHVNKAAMIARPEQRLTMNALLTNALRMRPDRIIVGEVRGPEALTLFDAMNTGHQGTLGTLHADNARECLTRVTTPPMNVPMQLLNALDLVVVLARVNTPHGPKRAVQEITEISTSGGEPRFNTLARYDAARGMLADTGIPSRLRAAIAQAAGLTPKDFDTVVKDREKLLEQLVQNDTGSPWQLFHTINQLHGHWRDELAGEEHKGLLEKVLGVFFRR